MLSRLIPSRKDNPDGLHQRYAVCKINDDGTLQPPDQDAVYIVLRLDKKGDDPIWTKSCRSAVKWLAGQLRIEGHNLNLVKDLYELVYKLEQMENE